MQLVISTFMIIAYTIYFHLFTKSKKQQVCPSLGKCISMSLGMVSSTLLGLIFAQFMPGELAYSTFLAILVSMIIAYFIGKCFGVSGIIEAMAASFMGAMMGTMLGDMIPEKDLTFMMIALDLIYLGTVVTFMFMINKEHGKENRVKGITTAPLFLSLILFLSMIGFVATIEGGTQGINKNPEMMVEHHHH